MRFSRPGLSIGICSLFLGGCVTTQPQPELHSVEELTDVPFFPQTEYDCGPAALATILNDADVAVTPQALIDLVYIESLRGSLQAELLAATRRFDLLPVPIPPTPEGLLEEVASGRPVLVLQNLGLENAPVWHYAVVVGFDAEQSRMILRSGAERRRLERTGRFLRSWRLADHWGFVAVPPGEIPVSATPERYLRALVGSQRQLSQQHTAAAYAAALARWPEDANVLFLAATHRYATAKLADAADLYRKLLALDPDHAAARNNLANVLLEQGCRADAYREAQRALRQHSPDGAFYTDIVDTLRRIEGTTQSELAPASCTTS